MTFLNPIKAYDLITDAFSRIIDELGKEDRDSLRIGFLFHTCTMIERVLTGERLTYNGIEKLIEKKNRLYKTIKNNFTDIEEIFGIEVPDTEIGYIMDLLDTQ